MKKAYIATVFVITLILTSSVAAVVLLYNKPKTTFAPTQYTYSVINEYPHDQNAFTEGLIYQNGYIYESTGSYPNPPSTLRQEDLNTGNILQTHTLPDQFFGEGITIFNNKIIQLTWQTHIGFVYDLGTFKLLQNFSYPTEGWGLTNDNNQLIMSDGTQNLYFLNPTTYQKTSQIQVHDGTTPITKLNELEYVNGKIYANVWQTNNIAIINPQNGLVTGWINLTGIEKINTNNPDIVLNGIAYDQNQNRLFVTGKMWPHIFEIKITPTN